MPQPIETAPRDQVILTNLGFAAVVKKKNWDYKSYDVWVACDPSGDFFNDSLNIIDPTLWEPVPQWIKET